MKLKDLKKIIIKVPKDYIVDENSFLSTQIFLFAREDELIFLNKEIKILNVV